MIPVAAIGGRTSNSAVKGPTHITSRAGVSVFYNNVTSGLDADTVQEAIDKIIAGGFGVQGPQGPQGNSIQGPQGPQGNSIQGPQGAQGIGIQGAQGAQGPSGSSNSSLVTFTPVTNFTVNTGLLGTTSARILKLDSTPPHYNGVFAGQWTGAQGTGGTYTTLGSFASADAPPDTTWTTALYGTGFGNLVTGTPAFISPGATGGTVNVYNNSTTPIDTNDFIIISSVAWLNV